MLAAKFWDDDTGFWNIDIAHLAGLNVKELNKIERFFLSTLEYNLVVTQNELDLFIDWLFDNEGKKPTCTIV